MQLKLAQIIILLGSISFLGYASASDNERAMSDAKSLNEAQIEKLEAFFQKLKRPQNWEGQVKTEYLSWNPKSQTDSVHLTLEFKRDGLQNWFLQRIYRYPDHRERWESDRLEVRDDAFYVQSLSPHDAARIEKLTANTLTFSLKARDFLGNPIKITHSYHFINSPQQYGEDRLRHVQLKRKNSRVIYRLKGVLSE